MADTESDFEPGDVVEAFAFDAWLPSVVGDGAAVLAEVGDSARDGLREEFEAGREIYLDGERASGWFTVQEVRHAV